jgi:hypothetical protein
MFVAKCDPFETDPGYVLAGEHVSPLTTGIAEKLWACPNLVSLTSLDDYEMKWTFRGL